jgi:hypothetical protein
MVCQECQSFIGVYEIINGDCDVLRGGRSSSTIQACEWFLGIHWDRHLVRYSFKKRQSRETNTEKKRNDRKTPDTNNPNFFRRRQLSMILPLFESLASTLDKTYDNIPNR